MQVCFSANSVFLLLDMLLASACPMAQLNSVSCIGILDMRLCIKCVANKLCQLPTISVYATRSATCAAALSWLCMFTRAAAVQAMVTRHHPPLQHTPPHLGMRQPPLQIGASPLLLLMPASGLLPLLGPPV